jgi:hypothetical protein
MTISVSVDVEAETEEEALEKAIDCPVMRLCNYCSNAREEEWSADELDGEVQLKEAVKLDE